MASKNTDKRYNQGPRMGRAGRRHRHRRHYRPRTRATGDLVHVELPIQNGPSSNRGLCGRGSVKAASDVYAPLAGKIVEINETIVEDPSS